jgi:hypothetical protein
VAGTAGSPPQHNPDQRDPSWSGRLLSPDPALSRLRQCSIEFEPNARTAVVDVTRATYRVSGFRWPDAFLISWAEAAIATTVASLLAAEIVIAAVLVFDPSQSKGSALVGLRSVVGAAAVVFAAAPLIAAAAVPRSIGTTLKETG